MSKSKDLNSRVIDGFLRSDKLFLIITLALAGVVDVVLSVYAFSAGITLLVLQAIIALVADALIILAVLKSNFRFAYSRLAPFIYGGVTVAITLFSAFTYANVIFENTALILFGVTHALSVGAVVLSTFNASVLGKGVKFASFITLILTLGVSVYYSTYVLTNGYFGQGGFGYKNVSYEYNDSTDTYVASETVGTNGNKIVIPNSRNGKTVSKIKSGLFNDGSLEEVYLNCDNKVEIDTIYYVTDNLNKDLKIYTDKAVVDDIKNKFKDKVRNSGIVNSYYVSLMNKVVPGNLGENERFISFDYTVESLVYANYETIKTWIGDKNETFSLVEHAGDITYVSAFNEKDETYLKSCYDSGNFALQSLTFDGVEVNGSTVFDNMAHVQVDFEKVYAIKIAEDNDLLYEPSTSFKQLDESGLRYVVKSDKNALINSIENRDGFSLSWKKIDGEVETSFVNMAGVLGEESLVTIAPVWTLNKPVINSVVSSGNGTYVYGDNFTLTSDASAPVTDFNLSYSWSFEGVDGVSVNDNVGSESAVSLNNVLPSQSGKYKVEVTAYSDTITSLTSKTSKIIDVTVNKKPINFNWSMPTDKVYSGLVKTVSATYDSQDVINADVIEYELVSSNAEVKNAGDYTFKLELLGDANTKYVIDSNDVNNALTVEKRQLGLVWETTEFTYDGNSQYVKVSAVNNAVSGDEEDLINGLVYSGYGRNAGSYNLTAILVHSNYVIGENATTNYSINPKEVTVAFNNLEFTYDGTEHCPEAVVSDIISGESQNDLSLTYSGKQVNAGNDYVATVSIGNTNYLLTGNNSINYVIKKKGLNVSWLGENKIYNGKTQLPEAVASGLVQGETQSVLQLEYTGGGINVGSYEVSVVIGAENSNYELVSGTTTTLYVIAKTLTVTWGSNYFVYNGNAQRPTFNVTGLENGEPESILNLTATDGKVNAGNNYKVTLQINNVNYVLDSNQYEKTYNIAKQQLKVSWGNRNLTYSGQPQLPTYTLEGLVNNESELDIGFNVTGAKTDVGTYSATASITSANYNINSGANTSFIIAKRKVTLTWENLEFTYDATAHYPTVTSADNMAEGHTITDLQITYGVNDKINAGTYQASVIIGNANYEAVNATSIFEIKPKEITVEFSSETEIEYTGSEISFTAIPSDNNATLSYEYYQNGQKLTALPKEVGVYKVVVKIEGKNYKITGVAEAEFTIVEVAEEEGGEL